MVFKSNIAKISIKLYLACTITLINGESNAQTGLIPEVSMKNTITDAAFYSEDCAVILEDNQEGILEYKSLPLFSYTPPSAKKIIKEGALLEGKGHIYIAGDQRFLVLNLRIHSVRARDSYGDISHDAIMNMVFEDQSILSVNNIERDRGTVDKESGHTDYQAVFPLTKSAVKELQKKFIYQIGLNWEEGYELYELTNIDLIKNQLNCLK